MKTRLIPALVLLALLSTINYQLSTVFAQGTAFTYQGQLDLNGSPANGNYDFRFRLASDPLGDNYVGAPYLTNDIQVGNGLFITTMDFGPGIFAGSNYWLEVDVRTNGAGSYTVLTPLQAITPTPYAIFANSASNVLGTVSPVQINGTILLAQLPAAVITNNETNVTLNDATLNGTLNVPANVYSSGNLLLYNDGSGNFFAGPSAAGSTTSGGDNTAIGNGALNGNFGGNNNTAVGYQSIYNATSGSDNTAVGGNALYQMGTTGAFFGGTNNIALGYNAGLNFNGDESSNIDIGSAGVAGDQRIIRIGTTGIQTNTVIAGIIAGNAGGLTNLSALQLAGTVPLAQLPAVVITNNETGVTLSNLQLAGTLILPATPFTIDSGGQLLLRHDANNNFFAGIGAGNLTTSGAKNTADGDDALSSVTSGSFNTASGFGALSANTTGFQNTASGYGALLDNISGFNNAASGYEALLNNTNGSGNTAEGASALQDNTSGTGNTAVGLESLFFNTSGFQNTALGYLALGGTNGNNNIAVGYNAASAFTGSESSNIDIGSAGTVGDQNIIRIGTPGIQTNTVIAGAINGNGRGLTNLNASQLSSGTIPLAVENPVVITNNAFGVTFSNVVLSGTLNVPTNVYSGGNLLLYNDAIGNFFAGPSAAGSTTSGSDNTAIGSGALNGNFGGNNNTALGYQSIYNASSGSDNTAVGGNALYHLGTTGAFFGGTNNIALGYNAGLNFNGNESSNIDIGSPGVAGDQRIIRIGTPGIQTNTVIAGIINGNGGGLTNLPAGQLSGTIALAQLPAVVITNNETGVTLSNLQLAGTLVLPATPFTIDSGGQLLLRHDANNNFFAGIGAGAGNLTTSGAKNTADGDDALFSVTSGSFNTASGFDALFANTNGFDNTAIGASAMQANTSGFNNVASGFNALLNNTNGSGNTADGADALQANTSGTGNTAVGLQALNFNMGGTDNTALGYLALGGTNGNNNIAVGYNAASAFTANESSNIDIGNPGVSRDANTTRIGTQGIQTNAFIAGISGATAASGVEVFVNSSGQLGTLTSSARYKQNIQDMGEASDVLLALRPVTFEYRPEIDPEGTPQFGLVAEDVDKVDPDLVARDDKGKIYTVRYQAVSAMLLNEFLKQHKVITDQKDEIQNLKQQNDALAKQLSELAMEVKAIEQRR